MDATVAATIAVAKDRARGMMRVVLLPNSIRRMGGRAQGMDFAQAY
jgi:hypothetical protein